MKGFITNILTFTTCFLRKDCSYSLKRLLAVLFTALAIYLAIRDGVDSFQYFVAVLSFIAVLLGISSYDKKTFVNNNKDIPTQPPGNMELKD
jgi:hypothetical protein